MASTYSTSLRLELMATGDQSGTWGDTTNTNLGTLLEQAITGVLSVAQGDAELTLTVLDGASDQSRNMVVNLTGAMTGAQNVIVPAVNKVYLVKNSTTGGFAVTVKTSAGTGVAIAAGTAQWVYCDGTNVVQGLSGTLAVQSDAAPQITTIELGHASDTTLSRSAAGVMAVEGNVVPSPGSQASGDILYRGASSWSRLAKGTAAQILTMNAGATAPEWAGLNIVDDTTPQLGGMLDVNGQAIGDGTLELLKFAETASAVNELTITNAATGNGPQLAATGDDTNIDLKLAPKGTGNLYLGTLPMFACRAWVNFKGTGTVAIRDSGNVSSITDSGTGLYIVNLTTAMPNANYAVFSDCGNANSGNKYTSFVNFQAANTASAIYVGVNNLAGVQVDAAYVNVAVIG